MLSVLILCALLQSLQGASVPPPAHLAGPAVIGNTLGVETCDCPAPQDNGQQLRTVFSIVQSCLLTIFACVWKSIHPNIDGPTDSGWTRTKRRLVTTLVALIAPELVLFWALNQRSSAQGIADKYNMEFARPIEKIKLPMWRKPFGWIVDWFQPLPDATKRRGDGQPWTITHGFFIQMGGFLLYKNTYPTEVLDLDALIRLIREKVIDAPTVTESDIQDRSKGDTLSKAVVILQGLWFVVQCIARAIQRLPLSELEVLTLAFAVMNAAIYWAWWDKPQDVGTAICVPLKIKGQAADDTTTPSTAPEGDNVSQTQDRHSTDSDGLPLLPRHEQQQHGKGSGQKQSWLRRMLEKDRRRHDSPFFFLVSLPYRIVLCVIRQLYKTNASIQLDKDQLRVPMFFIVPKNDSVSDTAFCAMGTVFGAIHLIAWASEFHSPRDRVLWRISAMIITMEPLIFALSMTMDFLKAQLLENLVGVLFLLAAPFYVASRVILIVIALKAMHHPHPNVLLDITWTRYIPHF